MNQILPEDIKLLSIDVVNDDFSARFNVKEKTYVYRFNIGEEDIFLRNYEYQIKQNIDIEKIKNLCYEGNSANFDLYFDNVFFCAHKVKYYFA